MMRMIPQSSKQINKEGTGDGMCVWSGGEQELCDF